ncbi:hypothetical protein [Clostridium sp.]|uniref:hypothetical protein n=1 Tax=Clostridium sp. TaxID=1506 RepID=UPI0026298F02|nr:hypothetical protein [Clostridium sp.]
MNINDFEIEGMTVNTIKESRESLKHLLDSGEFSQQDYDYQIGELSKYDENLLTCWGNRKVRTGKFMDYIGLIIYNPNGEVVDFLGYC